MVSAVCFLSESLTGAASIIACFDAVLYTEKSIHSTEQVLCHNYEYELECDVFAEELLVLDADSPLWQPIRPLLDAALRLAQSDESYAWHGWNKQQIDDFLRQLPPRCSLLAGVWETEAEVGTGSVLEYEQLYLGVVCEVVEGEIRSLRTFDALAVDGLKPAHELEPGIEDALEIMRLAKAQVAPVAWALFTDRITWNEWLLTAGDEEGGSGVIDKAALLASFAAKGRCVLMGSRAAHHHVSF
jgi:hypothetical protein